MSSRIYKLTSQQTPKIYIGSTKLSLNTRFVLHKTKFKNQVKYITANELLQYQDCKIELIENVHCESRKELQEREKHYIQQYEDRCVNKHYKEKTTKIEQLEEMIELAEELIL